jgi:hypothetical protein
MEHQLQTFSYVTNRRKRKKEWVGNILKKNDRNLTDIFFIVQGFRHLIAVGYVAEILFPERRVQEHFPGSMDINEICN